MAVVGDHVKQTIADRTHVVHDDAMEIDRIIIAGQPIPPDLVDAKEVKSDAGKKASKAASSDKDE